MQVHRLFTANGLPFPRLSPDLAVEIGLNESVVLLHIDYLLQTRSRVMDDDTQWTLLRTQDLKNTFPFWSKSTIKRIVVALEEQGYIETTSKWNGKAYDRTKWVRIVYQGLSELESIVVGTVNTENQAFKSLAQNELGVAQNELGVAQNEPTIHSNNINNNNINNNTTGEGAYEGDTLGWNNHPEPLSFATLGTLSSDNHSIQQKTLFVPKKKKRKVRDPATSPDYRHHKLLYDFCYAMETPQEMATLSSRQRGEVANALNSLCKSGADMDKDLPKFKKWWNDDWRSKDRNGKYQRPRPQQLVELWWIAVKEYKTVPRQPEPEVPKENQEIMDKLEMAFRLKSDEHRRAR